MIGRFLPSFEACRIHSLDYKFTLPCPVFDWRMTRSYCLNHGKFLAELFVAIGAGIDSPAVQRMDKTACTAGLQ